MVIVGDEGTGFKNQAKNKILINKTSAMRLMVIPLIAAGGIADAMGFMAALSIGSAGIYMDTVFMGTKEFQAPDNLKKRIVEQIIEIAIKAISH